MAAPLLLSLIPVIGNLLDKVLPDPQAAAEAKLRVLELAQQGELTVLNAERDIALAQIGVNAEEAKSTEPFRGGWRPAVGWVCVFGLGYTFILRPLLPWTVALFGADVPELPPLDMAELLTLLGGMLGLSGFRTFERIKGKA